MKYLLLILPLLMGFSSTPNECRSYSFVEPTEREDGSALPVSDIAHYTIYIDKKKANWPPIPAGQSSWTWFSKDCSICVQLKTVDIKGQESKFSECIT